MTETLEKAIAKAKMAPASVQDALGEYILAELEDEARWQTAFDQTTDAQWERMAEKVRKEIAAGDTDDLDAILS